MKIEKHGLATFFKIVNISTFAFISLIWQVKLPNLSTDQQYFLQAFAATITIIFIMLFFLSLQGQNLNSIISRLKVGSIKSYFYRVLCNAIGVPIWMMALKLISANEAMAITYLTPALTAGLAVFYLKEKVSSSWIIALILGLLGLVIMLHFRPTNSFASDNYLKGIILAVIAAVCFSLYNIICKIQSNLQDDHFTQAFYTFGLCALISLPLAIINWKPISYEELFWALGSGVIGVLSVVTLFLSYKYSTVVKLSPHSYFRIVITSISLYFLKDEIPSPSTIIAIFLILLGNSFVVFEKSYQKIAYKLKFNN